MTIEKGYKMVIYKQNSKHYLEITKHKTSYMDNILIINSFGSKKYEDVWIIEKDLTGWIPSLKRDGYEIIKMLEDVESPKKNIKNKKK
jgi:hypothetical protein